MYSSSGSRRRSVIAWWVKFHISVLILCLVTLLNLDRGCMNISSHVRPFYVFFKFVNSSNSVDNNGMSNFSKSWNDDIWMIIPKNNKMKNVIEHGIFYGTPIT